MTDSHYTLWADEGLRRGFAAKTADSFFASEKRFLSAVADRIGPVLDIGCASGRFVELLQSLGWRGEFTGVDIVADNAAAAAALYPQHRFFVGNAVDMTFDRRFDLVNATGVMQHEPQFEALVRNMLAHSDRYVMFDVKFGRVDEHLVDLERSYCRIGDARAYFICLNFPRFLEFLKSLKGVARIGVFGYPTPFNKTTVTPPSLTGWVSAGVMLEKGDGPLRVDVELPDGLADAAAGGAS